MSCSSSATSSFLAVRAAVDSDAQLCAAYARQRGAYDSGKSHTEALKLDKSAARNKEGVVVASRRIGAGEYILVERAFFWLSASALEKRRKQDPDAAAASNDDGGFSDDVALFSQALADATATDDTLLALVQTLRGWNADDMLVAEPLAQHKRRLTARYSSRLEGEMRTR